MVEGRNWKGRILGSWPSMQAMCHPIPGSKRDPLVMVDSQQKTASFLHPHYPAAMGRRRGKNQACVHVGGGGG